MNSPIVYVDSDKKTMEHYRDYLADYFQVLPFTNPLECIQASRQEAYPVVVSKYNTRPINGVEFLHRLNELCPQTYKMLLINRKQPDLNIPGSFPVVEIDAFEQTGNSLIKQYLDKLYAENHNETGNGKNLPVIIGSHHSLMEQLRIARRISQYSEAALISGETGTGKDLITQYIHQLGSRSDGPFHVVNCAAINPSLFESEFFGHKKGSFTGAVETTRGHFYRANHGTLVLDEISEIDLGSQAKLLRAIENQEIYPVGVQKSIKTDVRILAVTNRDLYSLVRHGRFREDLYHRLNILNVHLPALRDRTDDLLILVRFFIQKFLRKYRRTGRVVLDPAIFYLLESLPFPGNVRELEHLIYKTLILKKSNNGNLDLEDFNAFIPTPAKSFVHSFSEKSLREHLLESEREKIVHCLDQCKYNISRAAEILGISRQNLQYRLKKLNICPVH